MGDTYKNPRENIRTVTIFCFFLSFNRITEGSGSAKMTKSVTVDMMLEVSQTGYVDRQRPCIDGTMDANGIQARASIITWVRVHRRT